jgi:hypothetical protein
VFGNVRGSPQYFLTSLLTSFSRTVGKGRPAFAALAPSACSAVAATFPNLVDGDCDGAERLGVDDFS